MKIKELRIGNLVSNKDRHLLQVCRILVWNIRVMVLTLGGIDVEEMIDIDEADICGIPITEDILLKLGFQRRETGLSYIRNDWYIDINNESYCFFGTANKNEYEDVQVSNGTLCIYHPSSKAFAPTKEEPKRMIDAPETATAFAWNINYYHHLENLISDLKI